MRTLTVCTTSGCPEFSTRGGRCEECRKAAAKERRTTVEQRLYKGAAHRGFRQAVLTRDPLCVCPEAEHGHAPGLCLSQSTVADHYPMSLRQLLDAAMNPHDPSNGRGLCASCHGRWTASQDEQRGGWNAR